MSDEVIKRNDTKDMENLETIAKDEFIKENYEKRMHIFSILEEKNMTSKLYNIGTLINNKLVEIGDFFTSNGINFYSQSKLKPIIEKRLNNYYEEGRLELQNGIEHESLMDLRPMGTLDYKLTVLYNEELEKSYKKYKKYCKEVLNFNLLTHIIGDIIEDFFESRTAQDALDKLDSYEKELETLGYDKLVPVLESSLKREVNNRLKKQDNRSKNCNVTEQKVNSEESDIAEQKVNSEESDIAEQKVNWNNNDDKNIEEDCR